jgi:hypothetical protein
MRCARLGCAAWLALSGCGSSAGPVGDIGGDDAGAAVAKLSIAELQDPASCQPCHAEHYREWESSMHAYAARDPVFMAMNERGQAETQGELGELCVRCHAPMALELGLTRDGLNLPDLEDANARGVTCYFCHDVSAVEEDHNRGLTLARDAVMRGGLGGADREASEPLDALPAVASPAHESAYSALHDRASSESAGLCGACHDVVNGHGVELERTFAEWRSSRFAATGAEQRTCAACHMSGYDGPAAAQGPERTPHRHLWAGIDVALESSFPGIDAQRAAIDDALQGAVELTLAATTPESLEQVAVTLTNRGVGHAWPSGAAQDRRAWVELTAYDDAGAVVLQSGHVADGEVVGAREPDLHVLRDRLFDADGNAVHMFWQAAPSHDHPSGYASDVLPVPTAEAVPASKTFNYTLPASTARVTARLRIQPIGLDVLDDFQGLTLPITERVLMNGYVQGNTLRSRVRITTVPVTEHTLDRGPTGAN